MGGAIISELGSGIIPLRGAALSRNKGAASSGISNRIGFLPARQAMNRKNPMAEAVREIVVRTETGETLRLSTNDLDAPAQEIADLYKRRWQIELFFRLMKQTLRMVLLQRYWFTMRGGGGLAQAAWPLMRRCRTSRR
jgi:IS4 transposase